jgi:putative ABC transport system substrate-binding protein
LPSSDADCHLPRPKCVDARSNMGKNITHQSAGLALVAIAVMQRALGVEADIERHLTSHFRWAGSTRYDAESEWGAMRRREFITLVGGATIAWPLRARAQQAGPVRLIGALVPGASSDLDQQARLRTFQDTLQELGWIDGHNIRINVRAAAGSPEQFRAYAAELVAAKPDVLIADSSPSTAALQRETSTIPIVFARVTDPIGQGFVASMAQPGGNITGFTNYEPAIGGKWIDLLREAAPSTKHVALIYNPDTAPYTASFLPSFEAAARVHGLTLTNAPVHEAGELEAAIAREAVEPGGALILQTDSFLVLHRYLIAVSAAHHRLPTIAVARLFAASGCLMSYGVETTSMYRGAATYVDRILKGAKIADLPVQGPVKYELVINLKTAKVLELTLPPSLLATADEVIE